MTEDYNVPHVIHYCWFGGKPLPKLAKKCIKSWKNFFPDYEIKEWNESNFDINIIDYTKEAYAAKKYAFVSDYARFWILYHYGGVYFDTDVEVIKKMDDIIAKGPFMGCESMPKQNSEQNFEINPGLGLSVAPGLGLYKEFLDLYSTFHFYNEDESLNLKTIVQITTELLLDKGLRCVNEIQFIEGVYIYPKEYFNPRTNYSKSYELNITNNTRTIHHYSGSWLDVKTKRKNRLYFIFGPVWSKRISSIKQFLRIKL